MSTDLHAQLHAAVRARLEVAQATLGPEPWHAEEGQPEYAPHGWGIYTKDADGDDWDVAEQLTKADAKHIAANDPATTHRMCERDLAVLERHAIVHRHVTWLDTDGGDAGGEVPVCGRCVPKHSWFRSRAEVPEGACIEIRDLAVAYGLLDPTAGE